MCVQCTSGNKFGSYTHLEKNYKYISVVTKCDGALKAVGTLSSVLGQSNHLVETGHRALAGICLFGGFEGNRRGIIAILERHVFGHFKVHFGLAFLLLIIDNNSLQRNRAKMHFEMAEDMALSDNDDVTAISRPVCASFPLIP